VRVITDGEASASKISTKQKKFRNKSYKAESPLPLISILPQDDPATYLRGSLESSETYAQLYAEI
jgi:hypothetical protein